MKTRNLRKMLAIVAGVGLAWSASTALAQDSSAAAGVPQVIRLSQAQVSENTIIAYVNRSGLSYNLTADQIISLRQQGVSDAVITAMLSQPQTAAPAVPAYSPPPAPVTQTVVAPTAATVPTTTIVSPVTYVQPLPPPAYYYQPSYAPSYGWFPPIALSFAWGSGGHGGGYYGGWHGGGWHH
jgi:hypothetical protein